MTKRARSSGSAPPRTSSTTAACSYSENYSVIVAVAENRSRETCIALMSTENASVLHLEKIQDGQSYSQTLSFLRSIEPHEILLHDGTRSRMLSLKIVEAFGLAEQGCRVLFVSRQYFDQDKGAEMLQRVILSGTTADVLASYTALAASYCLLRYVENVMGSSFAPRSLRLHALSGNEGRMTIDRSSATELELVVNARSGNQQCSLFGVMNRTKTAVGARLLRSNILNPCTDVPTILERSNLVSFFLMNESIFSDLCQQLERFPDLDRMLGGLVAVPRSVNAETAGQGVSTLICLRHSIQLLAPLADTLSSAIHQHSLSQASGTSESGESSYSCQSKKDELNRPNLHTLPGCELLGAIVDNLCVSALTVVEEKIGKLLSETTSYSRSSVAMRHQACFAVRPDVDGMLDVARKTYLQCVEDIYERAASYGQIYPDATPKVGFSMMRGYHLQLSSHIAELPDIYIQAVKNSKVISCTTEEVASLSDRAKEAEQETLILTHQVIQELISEVRERMDSLFAMVESIALLDMLFGFAQLVATSSIPHCQPNVTNSGALSIRSGYHPIVASVSAERVVFHPNDIELTPTRNILILSGGHGAGKSTELKKVACLCIMAQLGSYIPAANATIPVRDRILTRIATADDAENNLSSFLVEMRDTDKVLKHATPLSLVLIDELGRGTGNSEGQAIALSVTEALISCPAYTLIATHHDRLCKLQELHPNVANAHLLTGRGADCGEDENAVPHQAVEGPATSFHAPYGIRVAQECGFPVDLVTEAEKIRSALLSSSEKGVLAPVGTDPSARSFELSTTRQLLQLLLLLRNNKNSFAWGVAELEGRLSNFHRAQLLQSVIHDMEEQAVTS